MLRVGLLVSVVSIAQASVVHLEEFSSRFAVQQFPKMFDAYLQSHLGRIYRELSSFAHMQAAEIACLRSKNDVKTVQKSAQSKLEEIEKNAYWSLKDGEAYVLSELAKQDIASEGVLASTIREMTESSVHRSFRLLTVTETLVARLADLKIMDFENPEYDLQDVLFWADIAPGCTFLTDEEREDWQHALHEPPRRRRGRK